MLFMFRIAFEVESYDCIGQGLIVMPAIKIVDVFLSDIEAFFNRLLCLLLHPIILLPDGFIVCTGITNSIDILTAIGANVIMDVIVIELGDRHLNEGVR